MAGQAPASVHIVLGAGFSLGTHRTVRPEPPPAKVICRARSLRLVGWLLWGRLSEDGGAGALQPFLTVLPLITLCWRWGLLLTSAPQVPCPSPLAHPFSTKQGLLLPQPRSIPSSRIFTSSMSQCSHLTMSPTVPTSSGIEYGRDTPICLQGGQGSLLKGGAGFAQLSKPSIQLRSVPEDVDICSAAQPGDPCSPWAPRSPITSRDELQLYSSPWACPFFFSDPVDTG